jgi:hypothetical protein
MNLTSFLFILTDDIGEEHRVLERSFLSISDKQIDATGFPYQFTSTIKHNGEDLVLKFEREKDYKDSDSGVYLIENGIIKRSDTPKV